MRQKSGPAKEPAEQVVKDIRRATRRHLSAEEKIRIVLEGLRCEDSIAELCRRNLNQCHQRDHISVYRLLQILPLTDFDAGSCVINPPSSRCLRP